MANNKGSLLITCRADDGKYYRWRTSAKLEKRYGVEQTLQQTLKNLRSQLRRDNRFAGYFKVYKASVQPNSKPIRMFDAYGWELKIEQR